VESGELLTLVREAAASGGPGSAAGVARVRVGDEVVVDHAWGVVDRRSERLVATDDRFAMASGSKGFTALAVLSLVADGTLALDTTARSILRDDLPLVSDEVTVGHLLSHRSGIGEYLDDDAPDSTFLMTVPVHALISPEDYLPMLEGHASEFEAGTRFAYSNGGFVLLALIAERASGIPFQELVRTRVLDPAGMSRSGYLRSDELSPDAAVGYVRIDDHWRSHVLYLPVVGGGDGGAYTTTHDMELFWEALLAGRIVPSDIVADMTSEHSVSTSGEYRYGLGLWLPRGAIALEGEDAGVSFWSAHIAESRTTVTVAGTTADAAWPVARALAERLGIAAGI
jgi:CubicO group peptidase (beta-lactamase class C family)